MLVCCGVDPVEKTFGLDEKSKCVLSISDGPCHRLMLESFDVGVFLSVLCGLWNDFQWFVKAGVPQSCPSQKNTAIVNDKK